jgi:Na+-translocating ferredoxin:NAD+ oxidoreductase subunit B
MAHLITETCNGCGACGRMCPTGAITGGKKSLHAIKPALCIDCGTCGRVCPVEAVKDASGAVCKKMKYSEWLRPVYDLKICTPCRICVETCPVNCLDLGEPSAGPEPHTYPFLKEERRCIGCGYCARECPVDAIRMVVRGGKASQPTAQA